MAWWPGRKRRDEAVESTAEPAPVEITGPAHVISDTIDSSAYVPGDALTEARRLEQAVQDVAAFLTGLGLQSAEFSDVFRTQNAVLHDVTWRRAADRDIASGVPAPAAVRMAFSDLSGIFEAIEDATLKGRGTDVRSMSRLVQSALVAAPLRRAEPATPSVWILPELDAATAMQLSEASCVGVVATSLLISGHGIEIATSKGFPCITGQGDADTIPSGEEVLFG